MQILICNSSMNYAPMFFLLKVNTLQIPYSHSQSANQDNQMIPYANNNNNNATDARAQSSTNKPNQLHEC